MTNFLFKSPRRLIKNSPTQYALVDKRKLDLILEQNRHLRQDLVDVKLMLNKLLITKHNQMEVDDYFERQEAHDLNDK